MRAPATCIWDVAYATGNRNYGATSAPLIVKDKVMVGTSGGDDGVRGFLAAFDAQTGKESLALLDDSRPRRKGQRELAGRYVSARRRHHVDARHLRSGAQHALLGHGQSLARLRRQRATGRRPLHELPAGARSRHRQAEVVLPVHPARSLRLRRRADAGAGRCQLQGPAAQADRYRQPQRLPLHSRPDEREVPLRQTIRLHCKPGPKASTRTAGPSPPA